MGVINYNLIIAYFDIRPLRKVVLILSSCAWPMSDMVVDKHQCQFCISNGSILTVGGLFTCFIICKYWSKYMHVYVHQLC